MAKEEKQKKKDKKAGEKSMKIPRGSAKVEVFCAGV